jgi:hypothetical protein
MLRPTIIANIKRRPKYRHILHIFDSVAPIFDDIDGLEIVLIGGKNKRAKAVESERIIKGYGTNGSLTHYRLSDPCAIYEASNCKLNEKPTIAKSRQEIFCEMVDVTFSIENYNVQFSLDEEVFADDFLGMDDECYIGVSLRSVDYWRDYRFAYLRKQPLKMWHLIDVIAKHHDGVVVVFDNDKIYQGGQKNVKSLVCKNIRSVWSVMSRMRFGVGVDSFGVHAFGSVGVPVYGIFGPTDPRIRMKYANAFWSPEYKLCKEQYCWYKWCNRQPCINSRTANFYWKDIRRKMGGFLK